MRLIFLDIDGVLNSGDYQRSGRRQRGLKFLDYGNKIDARGVYLLNGLVSRTEAQIVLSSTWRYAVGLETTIAALRSKGFFHEERFLDITPRLWRTPEGEARVRGHEIDLWLDTWESTHDPVDSFVILDDDSDMAHLLPRLVQTNNEHGLTEYDCGRAGELLLAPYARPKSKET